MNHTILSLQAKNFLLVLKNLEELIFNMAHIVDKTVFGFSITFMMLFAIPIFFGTDSIFSTSMPPVLAFAIYNFTSTTVSFILLSVNIFATSNHILNLTFGHLDCNIRNCSYYFDTSSNIAWFDLWGAQNWPFNCNNY